MVYLTKRVHFSASHVLKSPHLSTEENARLFGRKTFPHGHNYVLEVTLRGEPDPKTGCLFDFERLGGILEAEILSEVNYKHLDENASLLKGSNPTAENLVKAFWGKLEKNFPKGALYEIKLEQGEGETVVYRGD